MDKWRLFRLPERVVFRQDCPENTKCAVMKVPMPANDTNPLRIGDMVRIAPQFQDSGDDDYERVVIEAPEDCTRVLVETRIPGWTYNPTERIEASLLERL